MMRRSLVINCFFDAAIAAMSSLRGPAGGAPQSTTIALRANEIWCCSKVARSQSFTDGMMIY
jgi:hypothetical protein